MFPEKHIKDLESSERKSKIFRHAVTGSLFLTSFLFIGPLLHEFTHLALLELINCSYLFDLRFILPNGLNAMVEPLCAINPAYLLVFYAGGYLTTLIVGVALSFSGSILRRERYSSSLTALGTGMLLSVILTIGVEGDIQNALEVMNMDTGYAVWISLLVILGVFAASIHGIENLLEG